MFIIEPQSGFFFSFCLPLLQNFSVPENLSAYDGLELRLRGDGRRYKLIVRTSSDWDTVGYTAGFDTIEGQWQSVCDSYLFCYDSLCINSFSTHEYI